MTAPEPSSPPAGGRAEYQRVARASDIPEGTLLSIQHGRDRVCVFNHGGRIGAVADLCTHQAFPMSEGTLEPDGTLECAWHGARFDCLSGEVRQGPAVEPLLVYDVRIENGDLWLGPAR